MVYMASDGYIDQNNISREKYGSSRFKSLLADVYQLPIPQQAETLLKTLQDYQKNEEQRDDISVVGIRL
jgi:serine phosphatase RsbU (regulator of sigma subunit)